MAGRCRSSARVGRDEATDSYILDELVDTSTSRVDGWRVAYWTLLTIWSLDAALVMMRIRGGLFTSYAADLTVPAFLYIVVRGLQRPASPHLITRLFGGSPELAASVVFGGSALTEISQFYWPKGIFAGRFDPKDIAAYLVGVGVCYALDKFS